MNEIKMKERTPEEKELYYSKLALTNAMQAKELSTLNEVVLRKNYTIANLREKVRIYRALNETLAEAMGSKDEGLKAIAAELETHFGEAKDRGHGC
jgi:hypothetical protein